MPAQEQDELGNNGLKRALQKLGLLEGGYDYDDVFPVFHSLINSTMLEHTIYLFQKETFGAKKRICAGLTCSHGFGPV